MCLTNKRVLILLAPGFLEGDLLFTVDRLREAGVQVQMTAMTSNCVGGQHGIVVCPDRILTEVNDESYQAVVIPGGWQCGATLLSDPRIHQLVNGVLNTEGYAVAMAQAHHYVGDIWGGEPAGFISQTNSTIEQFTGRLLNLLRTM